jgi:GGDEF domain-containing protein
MAPQLYSPEGSVRTVATATRGAENASFRKREMNKFFDTGKDCCLLSRNTKDLLRASAKTEKLRQKNILHEMATAIDGLSSLSLYAKVGDKLILSYLNGKREFVPETQLRNGVYSSRKSIIAFPTYLYRADLFKTTEAADRDVAVLPIMGDIPLGMLVAESEPGKHLLMRGSSNIESTIQYLSAAADLYATAMSSWFNPTTRIPHKGFLENEVVPCIPNWLDRGSKFTIMLIDLDNFKQVNDKFGHDAGDAILREVGDVLFQCTRRSQSKPKDGPYDFSQRRDDIVIHWGGDEFLVIALGTDMCDEIKKLAQRIRKSISQITYGDRGEGRITASIGMVPASVLGNRTDMYMQKLDRALHTSKVTQKNSVSIIKDNGEAETLPN